MNATFRLLAGCCSLLLAACAAVATTERMPPAQRPAVEVVERYVSAEFRGEELDSLAVWPAAEGRTWLIASGKTTHRLHVFDADSGALLRTVGAQGNGPGQFRRPNGLAVAGDLLFVVERDNQRVQVLRLPQFAPVTTFGSGSLRSPYGIWLLQASPDTLNAYVTDSFMDGERHDVLPPLPQLAQRVRRFDLTLEQGGEVIRVHESGAFGDTSAESALRMVESIAGDPQRERLLIADEATADAHGPRESTLREYTLDGRATGRSAAAGSFAAEAEGVALWQCGAHDGYWIAVDQLQPLTIFRVFGRDDLALRGSFQGKRTAFTDGIALQARSSAFPHGALFAVHDDKAVSAFDLGDVARALHLSPACVR